MGKASAARQAQELLPDGETVRTVHRVQLKAAGTGRTEAGRQLGKDLAYSLAVSAVTSVIGMGVVRTQGPVWVMTTTSRLMLWKDDGRLTVDKLLLSAPLDAVTLTPGGRGMVTLEVADRATGEGLVVVRFGPRRRARDAVLAAATS